MDEIRERAKAWCGEDRNYWVRLPLLVYGVYILVKILSNDNTRSPLGQICFGIHELGHIVTMPFGQWIGVAGGSLAQVLAPLFGIWQFLRQEDFFGAAFCLSWLAESLLDLSFYIGDARAMDLPLANLFAGDPIHDWNYLLGSMHLLNWDVRLAGLTRFSAFVFKCEPATFPFAILLDCSGNFHRKIF